MSHAPASSQSPRPPVEIVTAIYDALRRRDLAAALERISPDIEIQQSDEVPWGGEYRGHAGLRSFYAKLLAAVDSAVTIERFIDAGDHVVALGRTQGTTHARGARFDVPFAHVWTVHGGLAVRVRYFIDNPAILAAL